MAHTITSFVPVAASGPGALNGFAVTCSCGDHASFAFEQMTRDYHAAHAAYMTRKEGTA